MGRVINTENPSKIRNHHRRSIAELLRRLSQKPQVDAEAKDMAATIVFLLEEIHDGVQQTIVAWEKRGYWMKAERFLRDWEWTKATAANFDDVIRHEAWDLLPELMVELMPRFADVQVKKMMRKPSLWQNSYKKLLERPPLPAPY